MTEPREPEFPEGGGRPVLPTPPDLPAAPRFTGDEAPSWSFSAPQAPQPVAPEPVAAPEPAVAPEPMAAAAPQVEPEQVVADQPQGSLLPEPPSVHSSEEDVPAPDETPVPAPAWSPAYSPEEPAPSSKPATAPAPVPEPEAPAAEPEDSAAQPEPAGEPEAPAPEPQPWQAQTENEPSQPWQPTAVEAAQPEPDAVFAAAPAAPEPVRAPEPEASVGVPEDSAAQPEPAPEPAAPAAEPEPWQVQAAEHEPAQPWQPTAVAPAQPESEAVFAPAPPAEPAEDVQQPVTPQSPVESQPEDTAPMARVEPVAAEETPAAEPSWQPEPAAVAEPQHETVSDAEQQPVAESSWQSERVAAADQEQPTAEREPTTAPPEQPAVEEEPAEQAPAASEWQPPAAAPAATSGWQQQAAAPQLPEPPHFAPQPEPVVAPVPVPEPAPVAEAGVWTHTGGPAAEPQPASSEWAPVPDRAASAPEAVVGATNAGDPTMVVPASSPGVFASPAQVEPEGTQAYPATSARSPLAAPGEPASDEDDGIFRPYAGAISERLGAADQNDEERKLAAERNALRQARAAALTSAGTPEPSVEGVAPVIQQVVEVKRTTDGFWGSLGLFLLRLVLAGVFGVWGVQMLLDPAKTQSLFATTVLSYPILATIVPVASLLISVSMVIGLATRYAAVGALLISAGALALVYWGSWSILLPNGFGFYGESELLIAAASLVIVFVGAGGWSLDGSLRRARAADKAARAA